MLCCKGETAIAAYLIEKGANVNHCDDNGMAPLHYAVENRHEEVARLLVEKGANVNARTSTGATVLHKAVITANMSTVKYLLSKGAGTQWKENDTGVRWESQCHVIMEFHHTSWPLYLHTCWPAI